MRAQRRTEIARAFARTLGTHGRGGATIAALAAEAGVAPGLVHHHFESKQDLYGALLDELLATFRRRLDAVPAGDPIEAYVTAALALDAGSDATAARAWVGVFAGWRAARRARSARRTQARSSHSSWGRWCSGRSRPARRQGSRRRACDG
jgi:TetR/AcrR family transcriptional regulator, transcriptional repressor of bet genes